MTGRTPLQLHQLSGLKILCRQRPEDQSNLLLYSNFDLWVTGSVMHQLNTICSQYVNRASTSQLRAQMDDRLLDCIRANVAHVSLTPLSGWHHLVKANDMAEFTKLWTRTHGDVTDVEPRFQKP